MAVGVRSCVRTLLGTPIVLSGDANVWWPECRERPRDRFVSPYIRELLEECGLSIRNPLARATHVAGAALDMVFISEECVTEHKTVHQGDGCCSFSPSCCPALGSDHFLCHFSFPEVLQGQHCRHASGPADTFPVVRDWEPILLAARTDLDSWAAAVQESCSEEVVGLPQRRAKASALFDDLLRILWDTARLI